MLHCIVLAAFAAAAPPAVELDFSGAETGRSYQIDLVVRDAPGKVLVSGTIDIGDGADAGDVRDGIAAALGDSGLEIVKTGGAKFRLASKGGTRLGLITYDTFVGGVAAPKLAGPKLVSASGGAALTVNGVAGKAPPPKK